MEYTVNDYKKGKPRWCPGCGDHFFLASLQKAMAESGIPPHETAVISGIGCSGRLSYYVNTYAMQTIHGRAAAIATGVKVANPQLTVWQISGDGDGLAIGGNHFIHALRRNIDINIILLNNRIYGLTKGQYSPTSPRGFVSKSSPYGTIEDLSVRLNYVSAHVVASLHALWPTTAPIRWQHSRQPNSTKGLRYAKFCRTA